MNNEHTVIYYGPQALPAFTADITRLHTQPATWATAPAPVKFERSKQIKNEVLFTDYDMVQAEVYWMRTLDNYDPKKEAAVTMFNNYFGAGSMGAIVFQTIRESKALAYSTYAFYRTPNTKNEKYNMVAYVGTQADKIHEAIAGMNELLNVFPASENNLETAKASMKKNYQTERITQDNIINTYLNNQERGYCISEHNLCKYLLLNPCLILIFVVHRIQVHKQKLF